MLTLFLACLLAGVITTGVCWKITDRPDRGDYSKISVFLVWCIIMGLLEWVVIGGVLVKLISWLMKG